jgi:hypothetical protein
MGKNRQKVTCNQCLQFFVCSDCFIVYNQQTNSLLCYCRQDCFCGIMRNHYKVMVNYVFFVQHGFKGFKRLSCGFYKCYPGW